MKQVFTTESKEQYIAKKTRDLQQFGYPNLTKDEVREQLEKALNGEKLNVIGLFIQSDIRKSER